MMKRLSLLLVVLLPACDDGDKSAGDPPEPSGTPTVSATSDSGPFVTPGQIVTLTVVTSASAPLIGTWVVDGPATIDQTASAAPIVSIATSALSGETVTLTASVGVTVGGTVYDLQAQVVLTTRAIVHDDTYVVSRDTLFEANVSLGVLANDMGALSSTVNTKLETPPEHGTVLVGWLGDFAYQPAPGYAGADAFTYTLTEKTGLTTTATVSLSVETVLLARDDVIAVSGTGARSWFAEAQLTANDDAPAGVASVAFDPPAGITLTSTNDPHALPMPGIVLDTPVDTRFNPDAYFYQGTAYKVAATSTGTFGIPYTITDTTGATSSAIATVVVMEASPLGAALTLLMNESSVGTMTLSSTGGCWLTATALTVQSGSTGTLYEKSIGGTRGTALQLSISTYLPGGDVYFVPQAFKSSESTSSSPPYNLFATLAYSVRDAFEYSGPVTAGIVVFAIDEP